MGGSVLKRFTSPKQQNEEEKHPDPWAEDEEETRSDSPDENGKKHPDPWAEDEGQKHPDPWAEEEKKHPDPWAEDEETPAADGGKADGEKADASGAEPKDESRYPLVRLAHSCGFPVADSPNAFFVSGIKTKDDEAFWNALNDKAESLLKLMADSWGDPVSANSQLEVGIARDWSQARGLLLPPIGKGEAAPLEELLDEAESAGIHFGLDRDTLEKMLSQHAWFEVFPLAAGKPLKNGTDGRVEELFPREKRITLEVDDKEMVDFKNLNWLQCVNKGDVICNIIPPTAPEDGCDVGGNVIKGKPGRDPRLPRGKNIIESEDGTKLIAETDGQIAFSGNVFKVNPLVSIDGNIDSAVGNLNVVGSINVKGNVLEGFTVRATGDIHIFGSVVGATVEAAGDIKINGGVNGGSVSAGGNLVTKFIENTTAEVTGLITAENIISSTVTCGEKIKALAGKGAIIGGSITSFKGIEAKVIGNESNLPTKMIVGCDPQLSKERLDLKAEVAALSKKSDETGKNIRYLENMEQVDQAQQQLLGKLRLDFSVTNMNIAKKTARIQALEEQLQGDGYQIVASHIYPPLMVTMGTITQHFLDESRMSRIYKADGDIRLGMK